MNKIAFELYKIAAEIKYSNIKKDAGIMDKIKRAVTTTILGLASMFIFDESAEAAQIKNPKQYGQQIEQVLQKETGRDYKIKVDDTKKGAVQAVKLTISVDGENIGVINFLGTIDDKFDNIELKGKRDLAPQDEMILKTIYETMTESFVKNTP